MANQSSLAAGSHQHFFYNATTTLQVGTGDSLYAYVYLDPANPPSEVMLQWYDGSWEHRAYWGANSLNYGTDNTPGKRFMGTLPPAGSWVQLSVPASQINLEGHTLNGMAFTLFNGRATWDTVGRRTAAQTVSASTPRLSLSASGATVTWNSTSGSVYQVSYKSNLTDPAWTVGSGNITATGTQASCANGSTAFRKYSKPWRVGSCCRPEKVRPSPPTSAARCWGRSFRMVAKPIPRPDA
jgi:hypothetical protein